MAYTLTMKFGGTSVGDAQVIRQVIGIVGQNHRPPARRVVVVVSGLSGTTDLLLVGAQSAGDGEAGRAAEVSDEVRRAHQRVIDALAGDAAAALTGDTGGPPPRGGSADTPASTSVQIQTSSVSRHAPTIEAL